MDRFSIEEVENMNSNGEHWIACKLYDTEKEHSFWIDCSLIDGYGNSQDFKTDDLYIDWTFNQYIFILDNCNDIEAKRYQEDAENIDAIGYFIDEKNDDLVAIIKGGAVYV